MSDVAMVPARSLATLVRRLELIGWTVQHLDLDFCEERERVSLRVMRHDGLIVVATADAIGRCVVERLRRRHQRDPRTGGDVLTEEFVGRKRYPGPRSMLREVSTYLASNGVREIALADLRRDLAALMQPHPVDPYLAAGRPDLITRRLND